MSKSRNSRNIIDSSDEEEGLDQYEKDDFLVDEVEEEEEEEEQERVVRKKKKHRTGKKRRRLDDDDLALLEENVLGIRRTVEDAPPNKLRRLRRTEVDSPVDDYGYDDSPPPTYRHDYGYDDMEEEEDYSHQDRRTTIDYAKNSEAAQLFGSDAIDDYVAGEEYEDLEEPVKVQIEPTELERNFMTEKDKLIQETDIPERLQRIKGIEKKPTEKELQEEAEWIAKRLPQRSDILLVDTVFQILDAIRIGFLEIPYIVSYRKDLLENFKDLDLWQVVDLDEKWRRFYEIRERFTALLEATESVWRKDEQIDYLDHLRDVVNEEQLSDLQTHFQLYFPDESISNDSRGPKRTVKQSFYRDCVQAGIDKMVSKYGITAKQFGDNLGHFGHTQVQDHYETPEDLALGYVNTLFPTTEMVLKAARYVLAHQIATDITVKRIVREKLLSDGVISTQPTSMGQVEIDEPHLLHCVKRLSAKPIRFVLQQEQMGFLLKGLSSKLITVQLDIPEHECNTLFRQMVDHFRSPSSSHLGSAWNSEREATIRVALYEKLLPMLRKECLDQLFKEEQDLIIAQCEEKLRSIARLGPHGGKSRAVVSILWGADSIREPVIATSIGRDGKYDGHIRLNHMSYHHMSYNQFSRDTSNKQENVRANQKNANLEELEKFIADSRPSVIVVGANCLHARELYRDVGYVLERMRTEYKSVANYVWGSTVVPQLCSLTPEYEREFPNMTGLHRTGIALARMLNDPLPQLSLLFNDKLTITGIPLHPLQSVLPKEVLAKRLERVLIDFVNVVGIDINRAMQSEFMWPCMQFICGLGPSKSDNLKTHVKIKRYITSRKMLSKFVGEIVNRNMIGFIRIEEDYVEESGQEISMLDGTRIHPDHYEHAIQVMSAVIRNYDPSMYEDEDDRIVALFEEIEKKDVIEELQAIDFQRSRELSLVPVWLLNDIQNALVQRLKDPREPYVNIHPNDLFTGLTGEDDYSLAPGQLITTTVLRITAEEVLVKLDCGITGHIDKNDLSDEAVNHPGDRVAVRQAIQCRVKRVDKEQLEVFLTSRSSELKNSDYAYKDEYLCRSPIEQPKRTTQTPRQRSRSGIQPRMIKHPLFKNLSFQQAEALLEKGDSGEVIFRPSSKGTDHLTLTYKFHDDIVHIDIQEEDKLPDNPLLIGQKLIVKGQVYHDLNHIDAHFLEPILVLIQEMKSFRKFTSHPEEMIINDLQEAKKKNPTSIPYAIGVSNEYKGRYVLYYIPNRSLRREYISCNPDGYHFRRETFNSPADLVDWFKKNWKGSGKSRSTRSTDHAAVSRQPHRVAPVHPDRVQFHKASANTPRGDWSTNQTPANAWQTDVPSHNYSSWTTQ